MIEVEQKFILEDGNHERLLDGARFVKEVANYDTYYDAADYTLTKQDNWLRQRNGTWELKVAITPSGAVGTLGVGVVQRYDEIDSEVAIRAKIGLEVNGTLEDDLLSAGYMPFASLVTKRQKYQKDGFAIDIDSADFGYEMAEVELLVKDREEVELAVQRIREFAKENGLISKEIVRGKISEYLRRYDQGHFQALIAAGVISAEEQ